jgi:hypothetical protein
VVSEWIDVGECDAKCGQSGVRKQVRRVTQKPAAGNTCPSLHRELPCEGSPCATNCVLSVWEDSSECTKSCSGGTKQQRRSIDLKAANGGKCSEHLERTVECNTEECAQNCQVDAWRNAGTCSKKCGGGVQQQTRRITVPATHGGSCPHALSRQVECNTQDCPIDCIVSAWKHDESECSKSCGGGKRTIVRHVVREAAHGGKACPKELSRSVACNTHQCAKKPVDCEVDEWKAVGACSAPCGGGVQIMHRRVLKRARYGGSCPRLQQVVACNTQACPQNCVLSEWKDTGACSRECGGGVQKQTRIIEAPAAHGGSCEHQLERTVKCNQFPCPGNCQFSAWKDVSRCSQPCGVGTLLQRRQITKPATNGGACDVTEQVVECNEQDCPVHCQLSEWFNAEECSRSCGAGGRQRQIRNITMPAAQGGSCPSNLERVVACNEQIPCSKNCELGPWKLLGAECSAKCGGGIRFETRKVLRSAVKGGSCPGELQRQVPCNEQACPSDCVFGAWETKSKCSKKCGGGVMRQVREIAIPASNGGSCGETTRDLPCNTHACPQDCQLSKWEDHSSGCSQPCGPGVVSQTRRILKPASNGGSCPNQSLHRLKPCQIKPCAVPCSLSPWKTEGECSKECGGGTLKQVREVTHQAENGGACSEPLVQHVPCNIQPCAVDCKVSEFHNSGACSAPCGGGVQSQIRIVITPAENGGTCPALERVQECNAHVCPQDCQVSKWENVNECSKPCGGGRIKQKREVTEEARNGGVCGYSLEREISCNSEPCSADCQVSDWTNDASHPCSKECGGGERIQTRTVLVPATGEGSCPSDLERKVPCNLHACQVDCEVSEWSDHGKCSKKCGGGVVLQRRSVLTDPAHGGSGCPSLSRRFACNTQPCPDTSCPTTPWQPAVGSRCSKSCGGGERKMVRALVEPKPECKHIQLAKTVRCNAHRYASTFLWCVCSAVVLIFWLSIAFCRCPMDCDVGAWSNLGSCTKQCGGGVQQQVRKVRRTSKNGGACPRTSRTLPCNTHACVEFVPVNSGRECWSAKSDIGYIGFRTLGRAARQCSRTKGCVGLRSADPRGKRAHFWMLDVLEDTGRASVSAHVQCYASSFAVLPNSKGSISRFHPQTVSSESFSLRFQARGKQNAIVALLTDSALVRADELSTRSGYTITLSGARSAIHAVHEKSAEGAADTNANLADVDEHAAEDSLSAAELRPFWVRLRNGVLSVGSGTTVGEHKFMEARVPSLGDSSLHVGFTGMTVPVAFAYMPSAPSDPLLPQYFQAPGNGGAYVVHSGEAFEDANSFSIVFAVRSSGSVYVSFGNQNETQGPREHESDAYEVIIGGWGDRKSLIRLGQNSKQAAVVHKQRGHLLTMAKFNWFWISVAKDVVHVGSGQKVGAGEFMHAALGKQLSGDIYTAFGGFEAPVNFRFSGKVKGAKTPSLQGDSAHLVPIGRKKHGDSAHLVPIGGKKQGDSARLVPIGGQKHGDSARLVPIGGKKQGDSARLVPIGGQKHGDSARLVPIGGKKRLPKKWNLQPEYKDRAYKLIPEKGELAHLVPIRHVANVNNVDLQPVKKAKTAFVLQPEYE